MVSIKLSISKPILKTRPEHCNAGRRVFLCCKQNLSVSSTIGAF